MYVIFSSNGFNVTCIAHYGGTWSRMSGPCRPFGIHHYLVMHEVRIVLVISRKQVYEPSMILQYTWMNMVCGDVVFLRILTVRRID